MRDDFNATFAERLEHEKLEALKELAYGASHEINNPLANIAAVRFQADRSIITAGTIAIKV
jgi:signal transduction histidine kinase